MQRSRILVSVFCSLFLAPIAHAQFHDNGMLTNPIVKTDYINHLSGTSSAPLTIGLCLFPSSGCVSGRTVFAQSNYWRQNWPCANDTCVPQIPYDKYWSVLLNNETWYDSHNLGPFDQSIARSWPGSGLMGFSTLFGNDNFPGDNKWRAHLVTNFINFQIPMAGGIPFEGFGEYHSRGNGSHPLGYLNPSSASFPSVLSWGERLWGPPNYPVVNPAAPSQPPTLATYLYVEAAWGSYAKGVFITLWHWNIENSVPPGAPALNKHNTRVVESALYPGAQIGYIDAEDMSFYCGFVVQSLNANTRVDINYSISLTSLFSCASQRHLFDPEPLPTTANIKVTKILWANEVTGLNGSLWVDIHSQKVTAPGGLMNEPASDEMSSNEPYGWETSAIADLLRRDCDATPGCTERSAFAAANGKEALELPVDQRPSRLDLHHELSANSCASAGAPAGCKN